MSAHTVISHALNQGPTPARLVMISAGEGTLMEIDSRELPGLRAQGVTVDVLEVVPSAHAYADGTLAHYSGTQDWGPGVVTVVKPWGGRVDPLYVVIPDGMDSRFTYVVSESELSPVGVSLGKATDRPNGVVMVPSEYALDEIRDPGFVVEGLPGWVSRGLYRNSLSHLCEAFRRLVPVVVAPRGVDQGREFI